MIKNYFKIAWRTLLRYKAYTGINVFGLTLSIAAAILIFALVSYQLSFDRFNHNKDRIYRIVTEIHDEASLSHLACVPQPLGKAFRNDYTFAEQTARVVTYRNMLVSLPREKEVKKFEEDQGVAFAEPSFFHIFDFPLVQGDPYTALANPHSALITESIAKKYFGATDVVGKNLRINNSIDFTITGILKDLPHNTDRPQEIYLSYDNLRDYSSRLASDSSWDNLYTGSMCFLLLKKGVSPATVDKAFPSLINKYYSPEDAKSYGLRLQPLTDIHTNTVYDGKIDPSYLFALLLIGIFLLATACMNFINMATAQALNRSKEVGIRKVLGSLRKELFWQFIAETAIITLIAGTIAWFAAFLLLPYLNILTSSQMSVSLLYAVPMIGFFLLLLTLVIFAAGSYPGLIMARFQPILALKSKLSQAHIGGFSLRRILVTSQFAISQLLIIGMIIIAWQMHYSNNLDMGFDKEAIVTVSIPTSDLTKMHTLRNRLAAIPGVENLTLCFQPPASRRNQNTDVTYDNRAKPEHWDIGMKAGDDHYLSTFGLHLVAGRNLYPADTIREFLVNETFVKKLGLADPHQVLGKNITVIGATARIAGVVKDFHDYSLKSDIHAICIYTGPDHYQSCSIKVDPYKLRQVLEQVQTVWNENYPDFVYSYAFLDDRIADFYSVDNIMLTLVEVFAGIAILISCLGLYGLVSFMALRKTKEIGIRKVLGAGIGQICWLFGREFSRLLLIAFAIAAPLAWVTTHAWLQEFKYSIHPGPVLFLIGLLCSFAIAVIAVGYRSLQAAIANPIKSLRSE
jgi:putative ABC transport system permease protein